MKNDVFSLQKNAQGLRTKLAAFSHSVLLKRPIRFITQSAGDPLSQLGEECVTLSALVMFLYLVYFCLDVTHITYTA